MQVKELGVILIGLTAILTMAGLVLMGKMQPADFKELLYIVIGIYGYFRAPPPGKFIVAASSSQEQAEEEPKK